MMQLYIHIPFCVKKCAYCDFLSFSAEQSMQEAYVGALQKELAFYGEKYKNSAIDTIFIGGGTPSQLPKQAIGAIMDTVYAHFLVQPDAEISIECNPGTVTDEKFAAYRAAGINRLSIGLQSVNNEELKALGRIHTFEQFLHTYERARHYGFSNINIDLMSALPGQTKESFFAGLQKVSSLKPEHISAYSLMIEEGTPFYERYKEDAARQEAGEKTVFLPNEEEVYEMTRQTRDFLQKEGYHWYEISNFAKPGKECRHNIGYWKRANYLGVGLGAASLLDNVRSVNTNDFQAYLETPVQLQEKEQLSRSEQMEEFVFLGLRMVDGFHQDAFLEAFGETIETVYGTILDSLQREGLLQRQESRISLTEKGIDLSNYALAQFLLTQ